MLSAEKITLEEHFVSLYDAYASFKQERIDGMIAVSNFTKCYKLMYGIPVGIRAKWILELGVGSNAFSTYIFLEALKVTDGKLISIDINPSYGYGNHPEYDRNRWNFVCADSTNYSSVGIDKGGFDILMIDSSHQIEYTRKELDKYVPLLRMNGFLYVHDTNEDGVRIPLLEFMQNNPNALQPFYVEDAPAQMTILRKIGG